MKFLQDLVIQPLLGCWATNRVSGIMSCKRSSSNFLLLYDDDEGDVVDNGELTQVESHEEVGHSEVANQKPEDSQLN